MVGEAGKQEHLQLFVPKILDLKRLSNRYFSENWRWVPLLNFEMSIHVLPWSAAGVYPKNVDFKNWLKNRALFKPQNFLQKLF